MSFLKNIFSSKKIKNSDQEESEFKGVYSTEAFDQRYVVQDYDKDQKVYGDSLKMIESYFIDNKLEQNITSPINHPLNLDQVIDDGMGLLNYGKAFQLQDNEIILFLAFAFNDFMIRNLDFKLYMDKEPEFPLRTMVLKYDQDGTVLSVYPFEYALKVMNNESSFDNLYTKVKNQLEGIPRMNENFDN